MTQLLNSQTSSQSQTVTFTVVATDNRGISTVSVPGTTVGGVSGNNYTFNKTYSYGDYSFGETTDTLTATATDAAGNSSHKQLLLVLQRVTIKTHQLLVLVLMILLFLLPHHPKSNCYIYSNCYW